MRSILAHHGLLAVFVLMAIDALFPAASELVMVYGGALASGALAHELDVFGSRTTGTGAYLAIALAGTVGYLLGALVGWAIGFYGGRPFLERRGRWFHLSPERLDRAERWFERWEGWAVFVGRLRECPVFHYKFVCMGHNTIRGAAGAAVLNAELMQSEGIL